jgi:hypothetical protein
MIRIFNSKANFVQEKVTDRLEISIDYFGMMFSWSCNKSDWEKLTAHLHKCLTIGTGVLIGASTSVYIAVQMADKLNLIPRSPQIEAPTSKK